MSSKYKYIFGPVLSRRLGFSLGVDLVPYKRCSFDCVYCELGRTTNKTVKRGSFFSPGEILKELKSFLKYHPKVKIDYITLTGSGEPTLNSRLKEIVKEVKNITSIPLCLLTNGSLFFLKSVRESVKEVDLIIPSLDAPDEATFRKINHPHSSLTLKKILKGLKLLRQEFKGKIYLEIMLVEGINSSLSQAHRFKKIIGSVGFDKIQLNVPARPSYFLECKIPPLRRLKRFAEILGKNTEIVHPSPSQSQPSRFKGAQEGLLRVLKRRPIDIDEICRILGIRKVEALKLIEGLISRLRIKRVRYGGKFYYWAV